MKYIQKTLQDSHDNDVACWIASEGAFNILQNTAKLKVAGWKSKDAYNAGKSASDEPKWVEFKLSDLQSFEAVWAEIAMRLISQGAPFEGGTIEDTEPEVVNENPS